MATWSQSTTEIALLHHCGQPIGSAAVAWAVAALELEHDTPSLRILAGLDLFGEPSSTDASRLFAAALAELGIELPEHPVLARLYVRDIARAVLDGEIAPRDAADRIHELVITPLEHPPDLQSWCHVWEGNSADLSQLLEGEALDAEIRRLCTLT